MKPGAETDVVLLEHMLECIDRIEQYTRGDRAAYLGSPLVQDAVLRKLQTLTESSQRLSGPLKATEPQIPWRELAGFRNVVAHGYLSFDLDAAWSVVELDLPPLRAALERMLVRLVPGSLRGGDTR